MKEMFYNLGAVLTAPFYHIYRFLDFLAETDILGIIISGTGLICGICVVGLSVEHDGSIWPEVGMFFLVLFLYGALTGLVMMAKSIILGMLLLFFGNIANFHEGCKRRAQKEEQKRARTEAHCGMIREGKNEKF